MEPVQSAEAQLKEARDRNNAPELIQVTVVWAGPGEAPCEVALALPLGSTLADAVRHAQCCERLEDIELGVFNRVQPPETLLRPGDRVEIYRPLVVDPKEARRVRAEIRQRRAARA